MEISLSFKVGLESDQVFMGGGVTIKETMVSHAEKQNTLELLKLLPNIVRLRYEITYIIVLLQYKKQI